MEGLFHRPDIGYPLMVLVLLWKSKIIEPTATEHASGVTDGRMEKPKGVREVVGYRDSPFLHTASSCLPL